MLLTISGGRVLNVSIVGSGLPTIILPKNISHLRGRPATGWPGTTPGTFFVYEAAGSGASGPGPLPRTTSRIVADLEQSLASAGLCPPYIVAGYSASGFEALLFVYRNKQHTRGLILIDPSIPFMHQNLYQMSPMLSQREDRERQRLARIIHEGYPLGPHVRRNPRLLPCHRHKLRWRRLIRFCDQIIYDIKGLFRSRRSFWQPHE